MNAKHTSGPWIFSESLSIFQAEGECELIASVACRSFIEPSNTEISTARLISAAPDLLAALQDLVENGIGTQSVQAARAAISKATGGQS